MIQYDNTFFDYVTEGAKRSAQIMLPELLALLKIESVLDVGCGRGAWLSVWSTLGVTQLTGVDGSYVDRDRLLVSRDDFVPHNLETPFDLEKRFDLVQCLEVAEHLPKSTAHTFVRTLTRHGDTILFSAAPKGQGGDHHINEQDYDYWRTLFLAEGYIAVDFLRSRIATQLSVEPWYRYNTFLYIANSIVPNLPDALKARITSPKKPLKDVSPPLYRLRKLFVRMLPISLASKIAKLKERRRVASTRFTD